MRCVEGMTAEGKLSCEQESLEGLRYCREHAQGRLEFAQRRERESLGRLQQRSVVIMDLELRLDILNDDQQTDRKAVLGCRREIAHLLARVAQAMVESPPEASG